MSNPHSWNALKTIGLIPQETKILQGYDNPTLKIELKEIEDVDLYKGIVDNSINKGLEDEQV